MSIYFKSLFIIIYLSYIIEHLFLQGFLVLSLLSVAAAAPQKIEPRDSGTGEGGVEITPRAVTCGKL